MPDILSLLNSDASYNEPHQTLLNLLVDTYQLDAAQPLLSSLLDIVKNNTASVRIVDENYINETRLLKLKETFTPKLLDLILDSDFEYGIESPIDLFIQSQMQENRLATKSWLNSVFVENISNPIILIGILRVISRLSYYEVLPEGQMIALAALSHKDTEVVECGVRAFENWGNLESLKILQSLSVTPSWLQDYIDKVVEYIRKDFRIHVS